MKGVFVNIDKQYVAHTYSSRYIDLCPHYGVCIQRDLEIKVYCGN